MKNLVILIKLLFCAILLFIFTDIKAQFANPTNYGENNQSITFFSRQPGNDIMLYSGDMFRVSSWDDGGSSDGGICWEVDYSTTPYASNTTFTYSNAIISDVCLLQSGGRVYAVAVYNSNSTNKYYWELFQWDNPGSGYTFQSRGAWQFASGAFATALHIDADGQGNFAIIWDDSNPDVFVLTGTAAGLNNSGNAVTISGANGGIYPDVAIFNDNSNNVIHATFIDNSNGDIIVQNHTLTNLSMNSSTHTTPLSAAPSAGTFYYPRIACPNDNGDKEDWTVVMVEYSSSPLPKYVIEGYNDLAGTVSSLNIYNNVNSVDLSRDENSYPVVTYDDNYDGVGDYGIWVGWTLDNTSQNFGTVYAISTLLVPCNKVAQVLGTYYWEVPNSVMANDYVDYLSLADRHANDRVYLTYAGFTYGGTSSFDDLITKEATTISAACSLRTYHSPQINQAQNSTESKWLSYYSNSTSIVNIKLFDTAGKMVWEDRGWVGKIQKDLLLKTQMLPHAIYLASLIADDGSINITKKLFIGN